MNINKKLFIKMGNKTITKADLDAILSAHEGNHLFQQALGQIRNPNELLHILGQYVEFSSPFGSGVLVLAGNIGAKRDLFEASDEVAAKILFAGIDEFGDRALPQRYTHRLLAKTTLNTAGEFFHYDLDEMREIAQAREPTKVTIGKVHDGYGVNRQMQEQDLLGGIGFHMGSEVLADKEFQIWDAFLRTKHPDLVSYLKSKEPIPAYYWIETHAVKLEKEHADAASRGANDAIRNYRGTESLAYVKDSILAGFKQFCTDQTYFMRSLMR